MKAFVAFPCFVRVFIFIDHGHLFDGSNAIVQKNASPRSEG